MKHKLQLAVQHWQYNPYGSRRHAFAFTWLTGYSFWKSLLNATIKYDIRKYKVIT